MSKIYTGQDERSSSVFRPCDGKEGNVNLPLVAWEMKPKLCEIGSSAKFNISSKKMSVYIKSEKLIYCSISHPPSNF